MNQRHLCRRRKVESASGPASFPLGGRRGPSSPEPPSTLFSVPLEVSAEETNPGIKMEPQVAQNLTARNRLMEPKPTEPDHRVGSPTAHD
jgi:hypothetical protein